MESNSLLEYRQCVVEPVSFKVQKLTPQQKVRQKCNRLTRMLLKKKTVVIDNESYFGIDNYIAIYGSRTILNDCYKE